MKYDAQKDIEYIEDQIQMFLYIVGLGETKINECSIDEIINKAREITDVPISEVESGQLDLNNDEIYLFLKNQRISLIGNIRRLWYMRQLALGALRNAV